MEQVKWPFDMREAVERGYGAKVSDDMYLDALRYATRKQEYLANRELAPSYVRSNWYLVELVVESLKTITLADMTIKMCRLLNECEKREGTE